MTDSFKDHFSGHAPDYASYRPGYPAELYAYLASLCVEHKYAWDCATGSGQAAIALTEYFDKVIATDASSQQIENAILHDRVNYAVASAEQTTIESGSIDLVTVAQALHWFDVDAFSREVDRVLKPGGIIAVWTYGLLSMSPDIDKLVKHLYEQVVGEYWPPERKLLEAGYAGINMPFSELSTPDFDMILDWDLPRLLGYLGTWSAVRKYRIDRGSDPVEALRSKFEAAWGESGFVRRTQWPVTVRVWQKQG